MHHARRFMTALALLQIGTLSMALLSACEIPTLELRDLAGDGNPCFDGADCCVVVDPCASEAFVVTADEFDVARDLVADRPSDSCAGCTVPTVVAECVEGVCQGKAFDPSFVTYEDGQPLDSCGSRAVATNETDVSFSLLDNGVAVCGSEPAR